MSDETGRNFLVKNPELVYYKIIKWGKVEGNATKTQK